MSAIEANAAPWWPVLVATAVSAVGLILVNQNGALGIGLYFVGAVGGAYYLFDTFSRCLNFFTTPMAVIVFTAFLFVATLLPLGLIFWTLALVVSPVATLVGGIWATKRHLRLYG